MLFACPACHHQYDVTDQKPGARIRCFCGVLNTIPELNPKQMPMQHCSNCGGAITEGRLSCEYCDATIALGDRGWGETCPECLARMVKGAKFCGACGVEIRVESTLRAIEDQSCPRCKAPLALCRQATQSFAECTTCGGVWLSNEAFRRLVEERQRLAVMDSLSSPAQPEPQATRLPPLKRHSVSYLPCPDCAQLMNRQNFSGASGVIIDWCRGHGYWFDLHELEHIQRFVEEGGLERARKRRAEYERHASARRAKNREAPVLPEGMTLSGPTSRGTGGGFLLNLLTGVIEVLF